MYAPISRYEDAVGMLQTQCRKKGVVYSLDHVHRFLEDTQNPHMALPPIVHIAGTNGKGSTLTFIASILEQSGYRVGTFTSPHIDCYTERISINGLPIAKQDFVRYLNKILWHPSSKQLTEFELLTAMSYGYFQDTSPDFIVYEVGLGGRLDATNVVSPVVSVITRVGYDHTAILGTTLRQIAHEKSGIIKPHTPVVTGLQAPEVDDVICHHAQRNHAPVIRVFRTANNDISAYKMNAPYQRDNIALAVGAVGQLAKQMGRTITTASSMSHGLSRAYLTGRYERMVIAGRSIIVDVAHNQMGILALLSAIDCEFSQQSPVFMLGIAQHKPAEPIVEPIAKRGYAIYYYTGTHCDWVPLQSIQHIVSGQSPIFPLSLPFSWSCFPKFQPIIITGSLYFVALLRRMNII